MNKELAKRIIINHLSSSSDYIVIQKLLSIKDNDKELLKYIDTLIDVFNKAKEEILNESEMK